MWGEKKTQLAVNEKGEVLDPSKAGVPQTKGRVAREDEQIKRIESKILERNLEILHAATAGSASYDDDEAAEWIEGKREVSAEEIKEHGSISAAMRHKRVALDNRRPVKARPGYITTAERIVASIQRARAAADKQRNEGEGAATVLVYIKEQHVHQGQGYEEVEIVDVEEV